jgi:uncharacterized OB-fold protein
VADSQRFDVPIPDDSTQEFWEAARHGRLLIKRCLACRRAHFYPRPFCPHCWSEQVVWEEASGAATVYTWSVVHHHDLPPFRDRVPYVAAIIELAEGPRMMTNLVDVDPAQVQFGMPVAVSFRAETDHFSYPVFRPA